MRAYERLLKYVQINTESSPETGSTPSTPCQWDLANLLVDELKELGLENPSVNGHCIVTAWLPATPGCENAPALGLLAHMDTAPAFSGKDVRPILHENYDGGDIVLPRQDRVIRVADFPWLSRLRGKTLITADGSTLLGADDKAGVAEIITAVEHLLAHPELSHGPVAIGFTPDEEVGQGADRFDLKAFDAAGAYTVDGGELGELNYENFNAAGAKVTVHGLSVHPGSAKDAMKNACAIACEFVSMLPPAEVPEHTQGREGFYHRCDMSGDGTEAKLSVIIRDHDKERFQARKRMMETITALLNARHGAGTVELALSDSYYNMLEPLREHMDLVENARAAMRQAGVEPVEEPIRGGTDGARLTYDGLPCPNLSTGGFNFHGVYEAIPVASMEKMVEIILNLVTMEGRN